LLSLLPFELLQAGDRPVEFAFYGSGVAEDEGEAAFGFLGSFVGDEVDVEIFRFGFASAIEAPHAAGDFVDDFDFERVLCSVFVDQASCERVEFGSIFSRQNDVTAGETVRNGILRRARFAFCRVRTGTLRMH
jgi:hypothetical protein